MNRILTSFLFLIVFTPWLPAQSQLTLENAIGTALKNNFDIRVAKNTSQVAEANNTAGNAGMLPVVNLIDNVRTDRNDPLGSNVTSSSSWNNYATLQLNWTLYDGGKMFITRQKLHEAAIQGELQFQETVQASMFEVVSAYYDLIRLKQQLRSIQQTITYNKERVTIAQAGFTAGSISKPEWLQAKIDLNEVLESLINQEFAIKEAKRALNSLLARDTETPVDVVDSISVSYSVNRDDLFSKLNSNNASLLRFQKQLEVSRLALDETKSSYLPTVGLSASTQLGSSKNNLSSGTFSHSINSGVSAQLTVPIYRAGELKRLQKIAELNVKTAETNLESTRLQMNVSLQNALNDFDNQKALLKIEEENNLMAKEYLEISIQRLRLGQTNSLEVHLAQEKFVSSNTRLIDYRYGLKVAETKLCQLVADL